MAKRKVKEEEVTWEDAIHLLNSVGGVVQNVASGTLLLKEDKEILPKLTVDARDAISTIAGKITPIVKSLQLIKDSIPDRKNLAVTEDEHPTYICIYSELIDINQCVMESLVVPFETLKTEISTVNKTETQGSDNE